MNERKSCRQRQRLLSVLIRAHYLFLAYTHTHTFIQNQKGSVRVHDEANESMEKQNCKKRKGKEKKTRELASILETNQSFFC